MRHARSEKRSLKALWITLGSVLGVLLVAYIAGAIFFMYHFGFRTTIDSVDCSFKTPEEVQEYIVDRIADYQLTLLGREGLHKTMSASEIGLVYIPDGQPEHLLKEQNPLFWPRDFIQAPAPLTTTANVSFNADAYQATFQALDLFNPEKSRPPADAYLEFGEDQYLIHPEDWGTTLDAAMTIPAVRSAVLGLIGELDFDEKDCYVEPQILSDNQELLDTVTRYNTYAPFQIIYTFGEETELLDAAVALEWFDFAEDGSGTLNQDRLIAWVTDFGARHDTVGTTRSLIAASGRETTVTGGTYGWEIDEPAEIAAINAALTEHYGETREPYYVRTAASTDLQDWGTTYLEVDFYEQHMYFFQEGGLIFDAPVVTGVPIPSRQTPEGVYDVFQMQSPALLRADQRPDGTREYETQVQYWMGVTMSGCGFHDATWQPWFGGDRYTYAGSHGCINMSYSDAQTLYGMIWEGIPVVMHW
ncbi:MAG: L,D-transpeptidase/peptidoglycan binding protein [Coriobacteriales bacterium]|jgi:hypothetical protein|nr:L,D-transpeptidase/peptidoglycan binding protein [Coriobacteriales bacterium]